MGEETVHPEPIAGTREGEERWPEHVEAVVHPGPGVDDAPPAAVLGRNRTHGLRMIARAGSHHKSPFLPDGLLKNMAESKPLKVAASPDLNHVYYGDRKDGSESGDFTGFLVV